MEVKTLSEQKNNKKDSPVQLSVDDLRRELGISSQGKKEVPKKKELGKKPDPAPIEKEKDFFDNTPEEDSPTKGPTKKSKKRLIINAGLSAFLFIVLLVLINMSMSNDSETAGDFNTIGKDTTDKLIAEELPFEQIDLGEFPETIYAGKIKPFDVFFNNDKMAKEYGFYQDDQQSELMIIPTSTKYEVILDKVEVEGKSITVTYKYGNTKLPRLVGQITKFQARANVIDFRNIESGIYTVEFINEKGEHMQEEEFNFTKPFYRSTWELTNLAWDKDGKLVFSANVDGRWELWSYDFRKDNAPFKLTDRHSDYPLDILTTLGVENMNIPIATYNNKTNKFIYHADQDIYTIGSNGSGSFPLSIKSDEYPIAEGMLYFDYKPQPTHKGDYIYFLRIFDPETSELWKMYYDGSNKQRVYTPKEGYIEDFVIAPNDKEILVSISERKSELMNGSTDVWIMPIKEKEPVFEEEVAPYEEDEVIEEIKAKKLTTVGYSVKNFDYSSDSKVVAFAMKEYATTSDLTTDIWTVNANNTDLTRLTPKDNIMDVRPVISPDNKKIAFLSSSNGSDFNLWLMDVNGENRQSLDRVIQVVGTPLWSLDSKKVYISDVQGNIFEFNLEENKVYRVLKGY